MGRPQRSYSFRAMLTAVFLALLLFTLLVTGAVTVLFVRVSLEDLAGTIVTQMSNRIYLRMREFFQQAQDTSALSLRYLGGRDIQPGEFKGMAADLLPIFETHHDLTRLIFALEATGDYFMLERGEAGAQLRLGLAGTNGVRFQEILRPDTHGWVVSERLAWDGYDPRSRPFFRQARQVGRAGWSDIYTYWAKRDGKTIMGMDYFAPVRDGKGQLEGVLAVDVETDTLAAFLRQIDTEMPGYAFILEETADGRRRVAAHPWGTEGGMAPDAEVFVPAEDSSDATVRALEERLLQPFAALAGDQPLQFEFKAGGQSYYATLVVPENDARWLVAVVLPRSEILGRVRTYGLVYLGVITPMLALAALAIMVLSRRVSLPLLDLHREADAVGRLDLSPVPISPTRIFEIRDLAAAMDRMKANLRSFQKYIPAEVVGDLVRSGTEAVLGGQKITATVYFSDIAEFTATAEQLDPEELVVHLGDYLSEMSEGIAAQRGTVDKFIGDAVMAFWNAPRTDAAHALHACEAALENQRRLAALEPIWRREGRPMFHTRIGLHTGPVVVGNIGSEWRMNYTIIGDSVNLASRLESLNKFYGTRIIVSDATLAAAGDAVLARPLDRVNVKGKTQGIIIYELLALRAAATEDLFAWQQKTQAAFAAYQQREFARAAELYAAILQHLPDDQAAALLHRRCKAYATTLPAADWDGIYHVTIK